MDKEQLSLKEAKRLSLLKWKSVAREGDEEDTPDECKGILFNCGFCERWGYEDYSFRNISCPKCEFGKVAGECCIEGSLWNKYDHFDYHHDTNGVKEVANNIILAISTIDDGE